MPHFHDPHLSDRKCRPAPYGVALRQREVSGPQLQVLVVGYILRYSCQLNLANVTTRSSLCSTGYCLAQTPSVGAEYLVYAPSGGSFTVDLSAMSGSRRLSVEWFNPSTGVTITGDPIPAASSSQSFSASFGGDAILYLVDTAGHATGTGR